MSRRFIVSCTILLLFIAAVMPASQTAAAKSGPSYNPNATITLTTNADPIFNTWDPNAFAESDIINKLIFSGVTKWGLNGKPVADLAKNWHVSKNRLIWTFNLRKGVKWQDGKPFTSADVAYTYNHIVLDKQYPTSKSSVYTAVRTVRTHGPLQVQFILNTPWSSLPAFLDYYAPVLPEHIFKGQDPFTLTSFNKQHPIGTGPYRMTKYVPGQSITLTRNPTYFGPKPKIKTIIFQIVPTATTQVSDLLSGSVDYINVSDPALLPPLLSNPNITVQKTPVQLYYFAMVNQALPQFRDVRVRQALDYAIDKVGMIKALLRGYGKVATGPIAPIQKYYYDKKVQQYPYNLKKALKLLAAAGYKRASNGELMKNGRQFTINFTAGQIGYLVQASELIQKDWQKLGIAVNLKVIDWNTYIQTVVVKRQYEASFAWWSTPPDPDAYSYYSCAAAKGGYNLTAYCNHTLDKVMNAGRRATTPKQRKADYNRMQVILAQQLPLMYTFYPESFNAMIKRLHAPHAPYNFAIDHISNWYVSK